MPIHRIGVISDTHYPERVPYLPYPEVEAAFQDCEMIIHAGDIESHEVITRLEQIAPVVAVHGDDEIDTHALPEKQIIEVGNVRIGIHHGHRPYILELPSRLKSVLGLNNGISWGGVHEWLLHKFRDDDVQVIVFGHFHITYSNYHNGILFFNPGSIYKISKSAVRWRSNHAHSKFRRFIASIEYRLVNRFQQSPQPTIGIITIENDTIQTQHIELPPISYNLEEKYESKT